MIAFIQGCLQYNLVVFDWGKGIFRDCVMSGMGAENIRVGAAEQTSV